MKKNNIILMGIKHCGKSTLGEMLAKDFNWKFFDTDELIKNDYEDNTDIREIYKKEKKSGFQSLEANATCSLVTNLKINENAVISLGGNTIENEQAIQCISNQGLMVYLKEEMDVLYDRIIKKGIPPFLGKTNPYEEFKNLFKHRSKLYEKKADVIVRLKNKSKEESFRILKTKLLELGYAG